MGRLCQGVGTSPNGKGNIIEGTNKFFAIQGKFSKQHLNQFHKGPDQKLLRKNIQHPPTQGHLPRIC